MHYVTCCTGFGLLSQGMFGLPASDLSQRSAWLHRSGVGSR